MEQAAAKVRSQEVVSSAPASKPGPPAMGPTSGSADLSFATFPHRSRPSIHKCREQVHGSPRAHQAQQVIKDRGDELDGGYHAEENKDGVHLYSPVCVCPSIPKGKRAGSPAPVNGKHEVSRSFVLFEAWSFSFLAE